MTSEELTRWGEETRVPLVHRVMQGERTFRPGLHCHLCPGRPLCRAWIEQMITMLVSRYGRGVTVSPQQVPKLSEQEVSELLGLLGDIESCQRPLEEWAVGHIQHGVLYLAIGWATTPAICASMTRRRCGKSWKRMASGSGA